jgi:hypothetical protein
VCWHALRSAQLPACVRGNVEIEVLIRALIACPAGDARRAGGDSHPAGPNEPNAAVEIRSARANRHRPVAVRGRKEQNERPGGEPNRGHRQRGRDDGDPVRPIT